MDESSSSAASVKEALDSVVENYHGEFDDVLTLLTGQASVDMYILLALLVIIGLLAALVFVVALRRL